MILVFYSEVYCRFVVRFITEVSPCSASRYNIWALLWLLFERRGFGLGVAFVVWCGGDELYFWYRLKDDRVVFAGVCWSESSCSLVMRAASGTVVTLNCRTYRARCWFMLVKKMLNAVFWWKCESCHRTINLFRVWRRSGFVRGVKLLGVVRSSFWVPRLIKKKKEKKRVPRFVLLNLFLFLLSSSSCLFTSDIVVVEDLVSMISSGGSCHCSDTTEIGNLDR